MEKMDSGFEMLDNDELVQNANAVDDSETEEAATYETTNIISHNEAYTMLSMCTEWFEMQEKAYTTQV